MAVVYVVQEPAPERRRTAGVRPPIDLTDAKRYGQLYYCLEWSETQDLTAEQIGERMTTALALYTEQDYVLLIGNPTAMTIAALIAALKANGIVQLLMWDRDNRCYKKERVNVRQHLHNAVTHIHST